MTNHTPVDRFAIEAGEMSPTPRVRSPDFEDPLRRYLLDWCIDQGIAKPALDSWHETVRSGSSLSQRGRRLCLELDIDAATLEDVQRQLDQQPTLLLRIIDWLVRAAYARLRRAANSPVRPTRIEQTLIMLGEDVETERARRIRSARREINDLEELLTSGNSAWTVDPTVRGLAQRLSDEEQATFEAATEVGDDATDYLREGWAAAWGLNPDGEKAHDRAIKALEAMFRDVVAPDYPAAKLNDIANYLRDKPEKWTGRLQNALPASVRKGRSDHGVEIVESIVRGVFAADCRHAVIEGHTANDPDDGRDAITLAVALIAMQRRGFLRRAEGQ